jgi:APA family basic amino acid/polyamine antiporter
MIFVSFGAALTPIAQLGNLTSIGTLFAFIVVCFGVIIMRKKAPDLPRPFRTPWVPVFPIVGVLVNFLLMLGLGAITWTAFLIWMAIGLIVYFTYSQFHSYILSRD